MSCKFLNHLLNWNLKFRNTKPKFCCWTQSWASSIQTTLYHLAVMALLRPTDIHISIFAHSSDLTLKMETELLFKTLVFDSTLTWLITQENFLTFMSYKRNLSFIPIENWHWRISTHLYVVVWFVWKWEYITFFISCRKIWQSAGTEWIVSCAWIFESKIFLNSVWFEVCVIWSTSWYES